MIPFSKPDVRQADADAVAEAVLSGWTTTGPRCKEFEAALGASIGSDHVKVASSLTAAVLPALEAIGVTREWLRGRRVVFPTWTFSSVAMEFLHYGAELDIVDVNPFALTLPYKEYDADVIVPTHLFGNRYDVATLRRCNPNAIIIDDAAHLAPVSMEPHEGADASLYSFYATKPLATGEGGAVVFKSAAAAQRFESARLHGINRGAFGRTADPRRNQLYDVVSAGYKANMTDITAALGLVRLQRVREDIERRKDLWVKYYCWLTDNGVQLIAHQQHSSFHLAPALLPVGFSRQRFMAALAGWGIGTSVHFTPLHQLSFFKRLARRAYPVANAVADRVVSLPMSSAMTNDEGDTVVREVLKLMGVWDDGLAASTAA